jgi:hypothetical protein
MGVWVAQNNAWHGPGGLIVPFNNSEPTFDWNDTHLPWTLQAGESLLDDIPAGVPVVNAQEYSQSTDLYEVLTAIDTTVTEPVYVQLEASTYYINELRTYSTTQFLGYANSNRMVMGLIGRGVTGTNIRMSPTAVSSNQAAMDAVLNATGAGGPLQVIALYFSNTQTSVPLFFSGLNFQGTLQTPLSVYSAGSQAHFRKNQAVPSPLCYTGIALWRGVQGARMQYCRFQGFAYALNSAPPFEAGTISSNYSDGMVIARTEIDGRIAAEIDASRPVAAGGIMWNKELDATLSEFWMHHTRRSGWATNTNTNVETESYKAYRVKCDHIANTNDDYAGDNGFFAGSNVEEVVGTFDYNEVYLNVAQGFHINWAVPYSNPNGVVPIPDKPVIRLRGFYTEDIAYGGCLRISVLRNPNATGESRVWDYLNTHGIEGSGFFDIMRADGTPLVGVKSNLWNSTMTPNTHFVVSY